MRNLLDVPRALQEQCRVLAPGGRMVALDTTPPRPNRLRPLVNFHLHRVIPFLGRLVAGDAAAYHYLPNSTQQFIPAEDLALHIAGAGFTEVSFRFHMFGTVAIHQAAKPVESR